MDEEIETLMIGVRADTRGFERDVVAMRDVLDGPLAKGAERAGQAVDRALARAVRNGKLGFDDLKQVALSALSQIAAQTVSAGIGSIFGGGGSIGTAIGALLGAPGRATGGPVTPGRAYMVGERGPELFVPTASGRIETGAAGGRDVRVAISINATGSDAPRALAQSGRQVARAVARAIDVAER